MVDPDRLVARLEQEFDCRTEVCEAIAANASALADTHRERTGEQLTVDHIIAKMDDAGAESCVGKWNWWVGTLGAYTDWGERFKL